MHKKKPETLIEESIEKREIEVAMFLKNALESSDTPEKIKEFSKYCNINVDFSQPILAQEMAVGKHVVGKIISGKTKRFDAKGINLLRKILKISGAPSELDDESKPE